MWLLCLAVVAGAAAVSRAGTDNNTLQSLAIVPHFVLLF